MSLFVAFAVFAYPAAAVWMHRRGSRARLWRLAIIVLVLLGVAALLGASPSFGNRLSPSLGYWPIAWQTLAAFGLLGGLPVLAATLSMDLFGNRVSVFTAYLVATVASGAACYVGVTALFYLFEAQ